MFHRDSEVYVWYHSNIFFVEVELYLANKLTAKTIYGIVQFTRYMSALIALRYGTFRSRISSSFSNIGKGISSHQVIEQP